MKRLGSDLFDKMCSMDNLELAYKNAIKGKSRYSEVKALEPIHKEKLIELQEMLLSSNFKNSPYTIETRIIGKERTLYKLPLYPDRIVHHALIQVIKEKLESSFISQSHHCISGRGVKSLIWQIRADINNNRPIYALKIDIKKFYDSIDNEILFNEIQRHIKCRRTLEVISQLVFSKKGLPIGNYTSVYFANLYLNRMDWFIKQKLKCKMYYRYADDLLFLHKNRTSIKKYLQKVQTYLMKYSLRIKETVQIRNIRVNDIFYCGVLVRDSFFRMRNKTRRKMIQMFSKYTQLGRSSKGIQSISGWIFGTSSNLNSNLILDKIYV